jgi:putative aldouronate transport system permease protein
VDGAGELRIFLRIVMPMAMPIVATLGLMIGLSYWNNWTNGLYFITNRDLYSVQQLMTEMVMNMQALQSGTLSSGQLADASKQLPSTSLKLAIAVLSVIPVMIIYPIFQKYFIKGATLGAVKG